LHGLAPLEWFGNHTGVTLRNATRKRILGNG
jgi:hypothetical protein